MVRVGGVGRLAWSALVLLLPLVLSQCKNGGEQSGAQAAEESPEGGQSKVQELIQRVQDGDRGASELAKEVGREANPELIRLVKNPDPEVRCAALYCLGETGGDDAAQAFVEALADEDLAAQSAAIAGLHRHPSPVVYEGLLEAYDKSRDSYLRQQVALVIGRLGPEAKVEDLRERQGKQAPGEAREGCTVALARLGDPEAQEEFIKGLHEAEEQDLRRYLEEYCEYIHAAWLLKPLLPVLSNESSVVFIGLDAHPEWTQHLRACDLAVNLVASISKHDFTFAIDRRTNYSEEQLTEVRRYVEGTATAGNG